MTSGKRPLQDDDGDNGRQSARSVSQTMKGSSTAPSSTVMNTPDTTTVSNSRTSSPAPARGKNLVFELWEVDVKLIDGSASYSHRIKDEFSKYFLIARDAETRKVIGVKASWQTAEITSLLDLQGAEALYTSKASVNASGNKELIKSIRFSLRDIRKVRPHFMSVIALTLTSTSSLSRVAPPSSSNGLLSRHIRKTLLMPKTDL